MKKSLLLMSFATALFFSGCGNTQPEIGKNQNLITLKKSRALNENTINLVLTIKTDAEPMEKTAVLIERASQEMDKIGMKYFRIASPSPIHGYTTDIESVNEYCFKNPMGIESKCKVLEQPALTMYILGMKEEIFTTPSWSIKEVLNDPKIKEYTKKFQSEITVVKE